MWNKSKLQLKSLQKCLTGSVLSIQPRANGRYSRVGGQGGHNNTFSPEYDDPANCGDEEDQYGSQYGPYGNPYDHYGSRNSVSRRSVGKFNYTF